MDYPLFKEDSSKSYHAYQTEAIKGNTTSTPLSNIFFSQQNVDALHQAIRYQVYTKSNRKFIIDKQSDTELRIVMRSVYIQYGRNAPHEILSQVKELNTLVLDYCVPTVLSEIRMHLHYVQERDRVPMPLARSPYISTAGTKTLELKRFM
jgi:hypothetical protein